MFKIFKPYMLLLLILLASSSIAMAQDCNDCPIGYICEDDECVVDVDLDEGYNNIDFIALNEGESSPNTAQLIVLDEFGNQLSNKKWLISTGYKAKLVVFKR